MTAVWWLVDMAYVVKASEGIFRLDYAAAQALLSQELGPTGTVLVNSYAERYGIPPGLEQFYRLMRQQYGMEIRLLPMGLNSRGEEVQRGVDVDLACQMVWRATWPETRTIVLTTGDVDLLPAVKLVRGELQKEVILYTYQENVSSDLSLAADEHWLFEEDRDRLAR